MILGEAPLTVLDVAHLAAGTERVALAPSSFERIAASRRIVEAYVEADEPAYGLNTGLGGNLGYRLSREEIRDVQEQIVRGRNIGVGEPLPETACRAALLIRIAEAAGGGSGLSQGTLEALVALFNAGVTPVIPARGSISAADLGLGAHMGAVLLGRGEAWLGREILPGAEALARAGLAPIRLEPKDGLAVCNHSAPSAGLAAVTLAELQRILDAAAAVAALSFEGYGANPTIFDARLAAARPAAGQERAAALFRGLLAGSSIHGRSRSVQDALSFRCLAPVFGAVLAACAHACREVEVEINGAPDNPLVLIEDGLMLSTANFHTPAIALAFDTLAIALVHLSAASAQRVVKLMNPGLSGLPRYLSPVGGVSAGYVPLQKTAAALHAEIRLSAAAASLDAMPVSDAVEDHAPLTLLAIRKLAQQLVPFKLLVALEALVAAQAADLREGLALSPPGAALHGAIRAAVPMLREDREPGPDVMRVLDILEQAPHSPSDPVESIGRA